MELQDQDKIDEYLYSLLFKAGDGRHVVCVSQDYRESTQRFNRAAALGRELGATVGVNRVEFPGGGYVEFSNLH